MQVSARGLGRHAGRSEAIERKLSTSAGAQLRTLRLVLRTIRGMTNSNRKQQGSPCSRPVACLALAAISPPRRKPPTPSSSTARSSPSTSDFSVREAIAIAARPGARDRHLGRDEEARGRQGPKLIDLGGRTVIPGLTDGHIHGIRAALTFGTEVNWIGVPTLKEALAKIRAGREAHKPGSWIVVAGGWTEEQFAEKRRPTPQEVASAGARQSRLHPASLRLAAADAEGDGSAQHPRAMPMSPPAASSNATATTSRPA